MLLNVQRGVNDTTPVSHHEGAAVILLRATTCAGDCGNDGAVTVDELVTMVNILFEHFDVSACSAGDASNDGHITVDDMVAAVNKLLGGCQ
jgi:hypothetical protein